MAKQGVKFDYDLRANQHIGEKTHCDICGKDLDVRWTDYHGEAVCMTCGAPYDMKGFRNTPETKLSLKKEFIPIIKEYWNEAHKFVMLGQSFSEDTGIKEFNEWIKVNHPELVKK